MEAQTQKPEPSRRLDLLLDVPLEVGVELGRTRIPFSRLLDLSPGDVLLLDSDEGKPVPVVVQGREKLRGTPSVSGGSLALVLDQPLRAPAQTPPALVP